MFVFSVSNTTYYHILCSFTLNVGDTTAGAAYNNPYYCIEQGTWNRWHHKIQLFSAVVISLHWFLIRIVVLSKAHEIDGTTRYNYLSVVVISLHWFLCCLTSHTNRVAEDGGGEMAMATLCCVPTQPVFVCRQIWQARVPLSISLVPDQDASLHLAGRTLATSVTTAASATWCGLSTTETDSCVDLHPRPVPPPPRRILFNEFRVGF